MINSGLKDNMAIEGASLPKTIVVSSEPVVQCETWVRARLLEMLLTDGMDTVGDVAPQMDQYLDLLKRLARDRDEPLADCFYAGVWAIGLARRDGIRVERLFENRVRVLVQLILAQTPKAEPVRAKRSSSRNRKTENRTKSENLTKG